MRDDQALDQLRAAERRLHQAMERYGHTLAEILSPGRHVGWRFGWEIRQGLIVELLPATFYRDAVVRVTRPSGKIAHVRVANLCRVYGLEPPPEITPDPSRWSWPSRGRPATDAATDVAGRSS